MYANNGFDDILYGYPLLEQHMSRNFELTRNLQQYHVMVNSLQSVQTLLKYEPPKGIVNQFFNPSFMSFFLSDLKTLVSGSYPTKVGKMS